MQFNKNNNAQGAIEKPFFVDTKKPLGKESIAQGAIEYLLIIGAAIIVVAIVVILISGVATTDQGGQEGLQSGYSGLQNILDLSQNKTTILLKLNPGPNTIEFSSIEQDNSLWAMFSELPLRTTVEFTAVNNCIGNSDQVNAEKTIPTAYMQNTINANSCLVPENGLIIINIPQEEPTQEVEVKVEIDEEPFTILSGTTINIFDLLNENSGNYKIGVVNNQTASQKVNNFTGELIALKQTNNQKLQVDIGYLDCVFTGNKPKNIENIEFLNGATSKILPNDKINCPN